MGDANLNVSYALPTITMSMGPSSEELHCCRDVFMLAVIRRKGLVFVYDLSKGNLTLAGKRGLVQYVVDALIFAQAI